VAECLVSEKILQGFRERFSASIRVLPKSPCQLAMVHSNAFVDRCIAIRGPNSNFLDAGVFTQCTSFFWRGPLPMDPKVFAGKTSYPALVSSRQLTSN
jgi:hypothetical protein